MAVGAPSPVSILCHHASLRVESRALVPCREQLYQTPFFAGIMAGLVTTAGILSVRFFADWAQRQSIYFIAFAAGVLVSVALLHLVPESIGMVPSVPFYVQGGYLALYFFNRFLCAFVCERRPGVRYGLGLVPLVGIGLHSFIDGFIYSITFSVSALTGWLAVLIVSLFPGSMGFRIQMTSLPVHRCHRRV